MSFINAKKCDKCGSDKVTRTYKKKISNNTKNKDICTDEYYFECVCGDCKNTWVE